MAGTTYPARLHITRLELHVDARLGTVVARPFASEPR
jgi:hypothetical protein